MTVGPGMRLGPYEIVDRLGAGGMGEVYRARDTRLNRTVAIKVLAADRLADPQMRQRFDREARAVAALSHPHICHLNDVGHHDGLDFLVMEYLEGETLSARLARVPSKSPGLPVDEVLRHGIEIAEALSEAHRHGIVHRDLKPGNVILTKTGVKLLDFGLAKLEPILVGQASLSTQGPTLERPLTDEGAILGTWPYMSPEQLEGKETDARTDIFAFGAVLYEMATGKRAFLGESHASLIAAILDHDPDPFADRLPGAPAALERVVRKCLAKHPDSRWQSARDLADALKWIAEERRSGASRAVQTSVARQAGSRRWPWVAALAAALAVGAGVAWNMPRARIDPPQIRRFTIQPPPEVRLRIPHFAISPDGRALVYAASDGRGNPLYLRALDQLVPRPIPGTEGAGIPAFSPDGRWVAFVGKQRLMKVAISTGAPPVTLADASDWIDQSITWLSDGNIVFGKAATGLLRVPDEGGPAVRVTTPDTERGEIDHHNPRELPGGRALLITRHRGAEAWDVAVLHLDTGQIRVIVPDAFDARYVPTGHLVFARGETLLAAPFDVNRLEVTGPPVVMLDQVMTTLNNGAARYAVADDGSLAYIPAISREGRRLAWVGPNGEIEFLSVAPRAFGSPTLSPDGQRMTVEIGERSQRDVWVYDFGLETWTRMTSDGASESPIWTRDGKRLTFSTTKEGRREIYWQAIDGSAPAERLVTDTYSVHPGGWSADGQTLAFTRSPPTDQDDIGLFDLSNRRTTSLIAGERAESHPRISPDGRWLAYASSETGRDEVFVTALDGKGGRRQISTDGGAGPVWARDGRTLYYRSNAGFFATDVSRLPATIGKTALVAKGLATATGYGWGHPGYDVGSDGRLLIVQPGPDESAPLRFEIVLNWFEELKQRVPAQK